MAETNMSVVSAEDIVEMGGGGNCDVWQELLRVESEPKGVMCEPSREFHCICDRPDSLKCCIHCDAASCSECTKMCRLSTQKRVMITCPGCWVDYTHSRKTKIGWYCSSMCAWKAGLTTSPYFLENEWRCEKHISQ
jgi:hypothetical protein